PPLRGSRFLDPVKGTRHRRAFVFDIIEPRVFRDPARLSGADVELQPQRLGADGNRLPGDVWRIVRGTEDVDQVDLLRDLGERAVDPLAEERLRVRVDRDDSKTAPLQAE